MANSAEGPEKSEILANLNLYLNLFEIPNQGDSLILLSKSIETKIYATVPLIRSEDIASVYNIQ